MALVRPGEDGGLGDRGVGQQRCPEIVDGRAFGCASPVW